MSGPGLTASIIERFGGLDLRLDPGEAGADTAIDLMNVVLEPGVVRTRDGLVQYAQGSDATALHGYCADYPADTNKILCQYAATGCSVAVVTGNTNPPSVVTSKAFASGSKITAYQAIGTPTASSVYVANDAREVIKYDGTTLTSLGTVGRLLALSPTDNRLVVADVGASDQSKVKFSDPGAPETFSANNYVILTPGDGETIQAVATWREFVFVFKRSRFFVFYGQSVDATGQPIFNYRTVDGIGAISTGSNNGVAATDDGVYFTSDDGVYRTTGGVAQKVSMPLDPWFRNDVLPGVNGSPYFQAGLRPSLSMEPVMVSHEDSILVWPSPNWQNLWVLNRLSGQWTAWDFGNVTVDGMASLRNTSGGVGHRLIVSQATGTSPKYGTLLSLTPGSGNLGQSRYQTGFMDFGDPSAKTIRECLIDGAGVGSTKNVYFRVATNYGAVPGFSTSDVHALSSTVSRVRDRRAWRAHNFSFQFSGDSNWTWQINRVAPLLRGGQPVGQAG